MGAATAAVDSRAVAPRTERTIFFKVLSYDRVLD
jgi:hypothetical protein